jgi:hypothetical protein
MLAEALSAVWGWLLRPSADKGKLRIRDGGRSWGA